MPGGTSRGRHPAAAVEFPAGPGLCFAHHVTAAAFPDAAGIADFPSGLGSAGGASFMPIARRRSPLHIGPTKLLSLKATWYTSSRSLRHQPHLPGRTDWNSTVIMAD